MRAAGAGNAALHCCWVEDTCVCVCRARTVS